jgi:hypothetical protein
VAIFSVSGYNSTESSPARCVQSARPCADWTHLAGWTSPEPFTAGQKAIIGAQEAMFGAPEAFTGGQKAITGTQKAMSGDQKAFSGVWKAMRGMVKVLKCKARVAGRGGRWRGEVR